MHEERQKDEWMNTAKALLAHPDFILTTRLIDDQRIAFLNHWKAYKTRYKAAMGLMATSTSTVC